MKKLLVLISAASLLFAGCAKEAFSDKTVGGGEQDVTFTVDVTANATKAVADGDGAGVNVNHWVMEVLDADGERYNYQEEDGTTGTLTHSFTVRLVKGQTYNVLFWADTKGTYIVSSLTDVRLADETTYEANLDSRDAFSAVVPDFQTVQATNQAITLKRAVSQLNVIFTDLQKLFTTMGSDPAEYGKFKPVDFVATAKVPTSFNVLTQAAGAPATTALTMTAAGDYEDNYDTHGEKETLYMDYFFSSADEKDLVDIAFSFTSKGVAINHNFTSVPFQRNYRTNILGELMSSNATWNVTVDPAWESLEDGSKDIVYEVVNDIAGANDVIASEIADGKKEISVKFTSQPDDAGKPGSSTSGIASKAIVTTNLPADGILNILVEAQTKDLYIGDFTSATDTTVITSGTSAAVVNINIPAGSGIQKLVINAPSKTIYLNGALLSSVGVIDNLDIVTSDNTLVVEAGQIINNLTFRQGALKIFGTVNNVTIIPTSTTQQVVFVRDCEGLSQSVYEALAPYVDVNNGYAGVQDGDTWNIVKGAAPYVAKVGENNYYTLSAAFDAVQAGQTITILSNCATGSEYTQANCLALTAAGATLDLNGKTITETNNFSFFIAADSIVVKNGNIVAGPNPDKFCGYNSYAMIVAAKNQNVSVSGVKIKDVTFTGGIGFGGASSGTEYAGIGKGTIENCTITTGDFSGVFVQRSGSEATILSGTYTQTPKSMENTSIVYTGEGCSVVIKGGTYNSDPTAWVHEDYKVTKTGDVWVVTAKDPVAKIGDKNYTSLEKALAGAAANDEIVLLSDCSLSAQTTIDKNLSFDLNQKTLSTGVADVRNIVLSNNAEVSFKNGGLALTNANALGLIDVTGGKSLTMTSVNMSGNTSDTKGKSGFIFNGDNATGKSFTLTNCTGETNFRIFRNQSTNCELTVTGGKYTTGGYNVAFQDAGQATYNGVTITVEGTGTAQYQSGIYVSGGTANIKKCTVSCPNSIKGAITVCLEGTATVEGGSYSGKIGIDILYSGGNVTIKDSTNVTEANDGFALYSDTRQSGDKYIGTDKPAIMYINGGTITGNIGFQHQAKTYVHGGTINGSVSQIGDAQPIYADGGTFSFNPATETQEDKLVAVIPTGYIAQAQGTTPETWKVIVKPAIEVATESALKTAISQATSGDIIKLTSNISLTSQLDINKAVTIDLNGKTITPNSSLDATDATKRPVKITSDAVLKNGTIDAPNVAPGYALINVHSNCTLEDLVLSTPGVPVNVRDQVEVTIKGASTSFSSTGNYSGSSNPYSENKRCYETAIYVSNRATVNIEDGCFSGRHYACAIATSGGSINVSGGTFKKGAIQTEEVEGNLAYSFFNDGNNTEETKGTITFTGTPIIEGSIRGRFNNLTGHIDCLNIYGGTFDSDCVLYNFNSDYIKLNEKLYSKESKGTCPKKVWGTDLQRGTYWSLITK